MKSALNISRLFRDVDLNALDLKKYKSLIIPGALFATTAETFDQDILRLESIYSHRQILAELKAQKSVSATKYARW